MAHAKSSLEEAIALISQKLNATLRKTQRNYKFLNGEIEHSNLINRLQKIRQRFALNDPNPRIALRNAELASLVRYFTKPRQIFLCIMMFQTYTWPEKFKTTMELGHMTNTNQIADKPKSNGKSIVIWCAQILLALLFGMFGAVKLTMPIEDLTETMKFVAASPAWLPRLIGAIEIAGALAVILPTATRILPWLTPLAAIGFAIIQILAIIVHANLGETSSTIQINLILLALSLFVFWGRWKVSP